MNAYIHCSMVDDFLEVSSVLHRVISHSHYPQTERDASI